MQKAKSNYNMRLVLNSTDVDADRVLKIIESKANKFLRLRKVNGVGRVTGEVVDGMRGTTTMNLRIPFDGRYQQDQIKVDQFNRAWAKSVNERFGVRSGTLDKIA